TLFCSDDCKLKVEKTNVTCPNKLWIDLGNAFLRRWMPVDRILCHENTWQWKDNRGAAFHPIGERQIACSAEALAQSTGALYGTIGGCLAVVFIIFTVIAIIKDRYFKTLDEHGKPIKKATEKKSESKSGSSIDRSELEENSTITTKGEPSD
ncbi:hypothetical protein PFISCL1PPCAC_12008, partial [Pristionchus fissidentatus]